MDKLSMIELKDLVGEEVFRFTFVNEEEGRAEIEFYVDSKLHKAIINRPKNSSWQDAKVGVTYTARMLLHKVHQMYQIIILGVHQNDVQEVEEDKGNVTVVTKGHKSSSTNVKDLPKEFTSFVRVVNLNVKTKSIYVLIDEIIHRVTIPKHIDAEAIDGKEVSFYVKGVGTLMVKEEPKELSLDSKEGDMVRYDDYTYTVKTVEEDVIDNELWFGLEGDSHNTSVSLPLPAPEVLVNGVTKLVEPKYLAGDILVATDGTKLIVKDVSTQMFDRVVYLMNSIEYGEKVLGEDELGNYKLQEDRTLEVVLEEYNKLDDSYYDYEGRNDLAIEFIELYKKGK